MYDYHVFQRDQDDDTVRIEWHGGATFNVWVGSFETDIFTLYGDDRGNPPTLAQARDAAERYFRGFGTCPDCVRGIRDGAYCTRCEGTGLAGGVLEDGDE